MVSYLHATIRLVVALQNQFNATVAPSGFGPDGGAVVTKPIPTRDIELTTIGKMFRHQLMLGWTSDIALQDKNRARGGPGRSVRQRSRSVDWYECLS